MNDWNEYFKKEDKIERLLRKVFEEPDDSPVCRNSDCKFTDAVLDYLYFEWMIDLGKFNHEVQNQAMDLIEASKGKANVPNVAGQIAYKIIPAL